MDFEKVKKIIKKRIIDKPNLKEFWIEENINTIEDILTTLNKIFKVEEERVDNKYKDPFVTIDYENEVISDLNSLAFVTLYNIPVHDYLKEYKELMSRRYFAYIAFTEDGNLKKHIGSDKILMKILYLGLVEFFNKRFNCFSANEEAIELLCKKYPQEFNDIYFTENEKNQIASTLYRHVSHAGTPNDLGYAFKGIGLIEENIKFVSKDIILKMINQYRLYDVVNMKVCRHQICAVILNVGLTEVEVNKYKFFYLDSLMIADTINKMLERENKSWGKNYLSGDTLATDTEIEVFKQPEVYWINKIKTPVRTCYVENKQLEIGIHKGLIQISYGKMRETFEFRKESWLLEEYRSQETQEKLSRLLFSKKLVSENKILFSLAFFENYRGVQRQNIEIDHRYSIIIENGKKAIRKNNDNIQIDHFYGKNIYSMTCIVGKNGTGKSSIVDFLRNTFFQLLELINIHEEPICEQGIMKCDFEGYEDILDKKTKFFIVFTMGKRDYYLTNIRDVDVDVNDIYPYDGVEYSALDELSKVVYFSGQIRAEQLAVLQADNLSSQKYNEDRFVDMSEESMLISRVNAISIENEKNYKKNKEQTYINYDLCYQLAMLKHMDKEQICTYLDIDKNQQFKIFENRDKQRSIKEIPNLKNGEDISKEHRELIHNTRAYIGAFSEGQYAKFSFMARLYWYLQGCEKEKKYYKEKLKLENVISEKKMLKEREAVVIFIDEGELYYHPEWQRKYLNMIFDMVQSTTNNVKIQLIVTTNSPFMISDVLQEDVQYLMENDKSDNREKTLGQNIHTLLKENFFMNFTIGEYSRRLINEIIELLVDNESNIEEWLGRFYSDNNNLSTYEKMKLLIDQIGEPVYRHKLTQLLEQKFKKKDSVEERIKQLEQQRKNIESEIERLKEEK